MTDSLADHRAFDESTSAARIEHLQAENRAMSAELNKEVGYQDRTITWPDGFTETGREAENRLHRLGVRTDWNDRRKAVLRQKRAVGEDFSLNDASMIAFMDFPPHPEDSALLPREGIAPEDLYFVNACRVALKNSGKLVFRAPWEKEAAWMLAHLEDDVPDLSTAPSRGAIVSLLNCRVNPAIRNAFFAQWFSKRMTPGDKKPKDRVLPEDVEGDSDDYESKHQAELMRRLHGE